MKTNSVSYDALSSFEALLEKYTKEYDNVSTLVIDDDVFIIKPVSRKDYKDIANSEVLSDIDKQDLICKTCILYPPNFDLDSCVAGLPEKLYEEIMDRSYILKDSMIDLIKIFREEMTLMDSQMECIILKAFPSYRLSEIEKLDMIQFTKLFTRAEWIINNMKENMEVVDIVEVTESALGNSNDNAEVKQEQKQEEKEQVSPPVNNDTEDKLSKITNMDDKPISKMTPEQKRAMDDFYKKYPQFDKNTDYVYRGRVPTEYKEPPALRPNWGRR